MEEVKRFGAKLRELRLRAGLTLRELAARVNVDFTYLSKIENGALPPPSERVILQLAEALNADKDELITLAGRIPSDISEMLKNREALKLLRAEHAQKKEAVLNKKEEAPYPVDAPKSQPEASKARKTLARVAAAIILTLAVGISLWFAAPVADTAAANNNQGVIYNKNGEYQKAIASLNKAIELDPGLAVAYSNRGWAYIELGGYDQAVADCTRAIELDPNLALAYSNRGRAFVELGQYEKAVADCNKAIELDPNLALAYSNRGRAYIELGQYEQAIADFDKAMALDPSLLK